MDGPTLKRLGARLRKEIVPLESLPYPMREALRRLAEKYDQNDVPPSCTGTNVRNPRPAQPSSSCSKC